MALTVTRIGTNPDGTPHLLFTCPDDYEAELVKTGPAVGIVQLADGTTYDVTDDVIEVASSDDAAEVHHLIGLQHERTGRFDNPETGEKWLHDRDGCRHCASPGKKTIVRRTSARRKAGS